MYHMTIQLKADGKKCLYEQIYEYIKKEMKEGKLLAGERLPSTRSMAEQLQVARSTVEYAYDQLLSEGYLEARPYKGYFVCDIRELFGLEKEKPTIAKTSGGTKEPKKDYCYDFSPNAIDMSGFPFGIWKKITKNILNDGNQDLFSQGEPQGDEDLRGTISRYLHSSRGVNCEPDQIVIGAGNDYLLMLLEKILGEKKTVAMENPTYKRAYHIFRSMDYKLLPLHGTTGDALLQELSLKNPDMIYVMPSHQFPTGSIMPVKTRSMLLNWAGKEEGRYVIEDDYDSEFRYHGKPIPALQALDGQGKVIYMGTFSKAIAPAIRVSYMVLPPKLCQQYRENCYFYSCTVSRIDQRILNEFIKDGYFERHLNKMRKIYRQKHEVLLEQLKPFRNRFTISGENAGLHLVLTAKTDITEKELIDKALDCGVKVYGMSDSLVARAERKPSLLLGFGGLNVTEITEAVSRLQEAWLD